MLTYTMNSTMQELLDNGFAQLEFRCKDCKKTRNRSLDQIESFLTLRLIEAGSACGSCGQATHYLKPIQEQHLAENVSHTSTSSAATPIRIATDAQTKPVDKSIVSEISDAYNAYIENVAYKNILEKLILSGRNWRDLNTLEQKFLLQQEKTRVKTAHLAKGGRVLLGLLTGSPLLF